ncbi:MAG: hypothetical protein JSU86_06780 [Phycisphaerales bacterium]|nr:MAG: hypothetical protein JSU86_06780 [Phycisphaerales bacterium]
MGGVLGRYGNIYGEVNKPLANEGADTVIDVNVVAKSDGAIRENVVELGIKESLSQCGIDADIDTR